MLDGDRVTSLILESYTVQGAQQQLPDVTVVLKKRAAAIHLPIVVKDQ